MSILNSPIKIGDLTIKNRLVMPPMATAKATDDGQVTKQICDYYHEKSFGGYIELIITENPSAQKQKLQSQTQVTEQETPQIPPKPVVSAEAAAYPKLLKIYKELSRQNGIIFDAERERNELELERDSLKGFAKLTKKGELQSRIDRKNEEIDLLKVGLSGIIKRYGYQNVQEFYQIYRKSYNAYIACKEQVTKWEKTYGDNNQKKSKESVLERLRNPPKKTADYQQQGILKGKDRGAR